MQIVCLDLEGVLIPEVWIEFSRATKIPELARTTRDEPDYDKLMRARIAILEKHKLGLPAIQAVISQMRPLEGAKAFLDELRHKHQVVILSDTYYEFAAPLMAQLGRLTLFCHRLIIDGTGRVTDYKLRMKDQKRAAVTKFRELNFQTIAAGDSYNDVSMLAAANAGILFCPPENVAKEFPQYPVTRDYTALAAEIERASKAIAA